MTYTHHVVEQRTHEIELNFKDLLAERRASKSGITLNENDGEGWVPNLFIQMQNLCTTGCYVFHVCEREWMKKETFVFIKFNTCV